MQHEPALREFPEDRTVRSFMDVWMATNGKADPRVMLDRYFWSYVAKWHLVANMHPDIEIERWCNDILGEQNWYRMFNKYWFTSEQDLVMFKLTWSGGPNDGQL